MPLDELLGKFQVLTKKDFRLLEANGSLFYQQENKNLTIHRQEIDLRCPLRGLGQSPNSPHAKA